VTPASALAGGGTGGANLLLSHAFDDYSWQGGSYLANGCSVDLYAGTPNGRYGDYSRVDWEGWTGCGPGGPMTSIHITTELRDALGHVIAYGPDVYGDGWQADSYGSFQGADLKAGRVYTVNVQTYAVMPPGNQFVVDGGCQHSADQRAVSCNLTMFFVAGADPPASSCLAWPAPASCSFLGPTPQSAGPTISGGNRDGDTKTASWSGSGLTVAAAQLAYQWYRCDATGGSCTSIPGAVTSTYTLGHGDVGKAVKVQVTGYNAAGSTGWFSSPTAAIQPLPPSSTVAPAVTGTPQEGHTLVSDVGEWKGTPTLNYSYQWQRCDTSGLGCSAIAGATGPTYILGSADVGSTVRLVATASNSGGSAQATSVQSAPIQAKVVAVGDTTSPTIASLGVQEDLPVWTQPDPSLAPIYAGAFDPPPTGAKFNSPMTASQPDPKYFAQAAVGGDRLFVADAGTVYVYKALASDNSYVTSFSPGLGSNLRLAYYKQNVYVYGASSGQFKVYDTGGNLQRSFPNPIPSAAGATAYSGIAAAWGEIWAARGNCAESGGAIDIFDTQTGAYKGTAYSSLPLTNTAEREASADQTTIANTDTTNCAGDDQWWDLSLAPDVNASIANYRVLNRNPLLSALSLPDAPSLLAHQPLNGTSGGTDEVWGMRWLLTAPVTPSTTGQQFGNKIVEYSLDRDSQAGFLSSTPRRSWTPNQPGQISDIAYRAHDPVLVATGHLMDTQWMRSTQCLTYTVTDGDFYLVGRDGEHWYNQASGVTGVTLTVDGATEATSILAHDTLCFDTSSIPSSDSHHLLLTASVRGLPLTTANDHLHTDHDAPTGSLNPLPRYARGTLGVGGTMSDAHSGPRDWQLQVSSQGANSWGNARGCAAVSAPDPSNGTYACRWDTTSVSDGPYDVRAQMRDNVSDPYGGPNVSYPSSSVLVDNTAPAITLSGDLYDDSDQGAIATNATDALAIQVQDAGAGAASVTTSVDGLQQQEATQGCSTGGCALSDSYNFVASQFAAGQHTIAVTATDGVGNASTSTWTVVVEDVTPGDSTDPSDTTGDQIDYACSSDNGCDPTSGSASAPTTALTARLAPPTLATPLSSLAPNSSTSGTVPTSFLACTAPNQPLNFASYSLGSQFQSLPLTQIGRYCSAPDPLVDPWPTNYVSYIYGDCTPAPEQPCDPPVEVQSWPSCERNVSQYTVGPGDPALAPDTPVPYTSTTINGLPAAVFEGGLQIELYTGRTTVDVYGTDPTQVMQAAGALQPAPVIPSTPVPAALPTLPTLPPPLAGAMQGTLGCTT
jgi:hypothetical protein